MKPNKRCSECGVEFYQPPCNARVKFCSRKCYHENRRKWKLSEEWKKNISDGVKKNLPSTAIKKGQQLSPETQFKTGEHLGETHPKWTGGEFAYRRIIERSKRKRACELCGITEKEKRLLVHHIDCDRKNNILDNLMFLCDLCHVRLHRKLRDNNII